MVTVTNFFILIQKWCFQACKLKLLHRFTTNTTFYIKISNKTSTSVQNRCSSWCSWMRTRQLVLRSVLRSILTPAIILHGCALISVIRGCVFQFRRFISMYAEMNEIIRSKLILLNVEALTIRKVYYSVLSMIGVFHWCHFISSQYRYHYALHHKFCIWNSSWHCLNLEPTVRHFCVFSQNSV